MLRDLTDAGVMSQGDRREGKLCARPLRIRVAASRRSHVCFPPAIAEFKKARGIYQKIISKDGKTKTETITGTDSAGKPYAGRTMVYDKQ